MKHGTLARMSAMTRTRPRIAALVLALVAPALLVVAPSVEAASAPGTPYAWGGNAFGELGDGTTTPHVLAGPVSGLADVVDVHAGREHAVALRSDGTVVTWGSNQMGQLGIGATGGSRSSPVGVAGLSGITMVSTGHYQSFALRGDGSIWAWGYNFAGQLGDGTTTNRNQPVRVSGSRTYRYVAAGRDMAYAVATDGTVWAWGLNGDGQLGDGTTTNRSTPVRVGTLIDVVQVAGGRDHGLAVRADGSVWAWGWNAYGQLGDGTLTSRTTPVQVATLTSGVTQVAAGAHHSYALRTDGRVVAWGRNYRNELGDGTTTQRTRPVTVLGVTSAVTIGSGRDHGLAALADGSVRAWGDNSSGQLGDGTLISRSSAVVVAGLTDVRRVAGGAEQSVALSSNDVPPDNQAPTAHATASCAPLTCTFDSAGSTDADGMITAHDWTFGDGTSGTGPSPSHDYATPGTYDVTLTVTDDDGATATAQVSVTVTGPPSGSVTQFRAATGTSGNAATASVVVPSSVQVGDVLVLFVSTGRLATTTTPAGWTLVGTQSDGADLRSWAFARSAAATTPGSTVTVVLDAQSKLDLTLVAYQGGAVTAAAAVGEPGTDATHDAPAVAVATTGSRVLHHWVTKINEQATWSLPDDLTVRRTANGGGSGQVGSVTADGGPSAAGPWPAHVATAGVVSGKAIGWTVVVGP